MQELSQGWHAKVVFTEVNIRRSGDWAWVFRCTTSQKDSTKQGRANSAVMRKSQGQWAMVELVSDSIAAAEDPHKEFSLLAFGIHEETSAMSGGDFPTELVTGVGVRLVARPMVSREMVKTPFSQVTDAPRHGDHLRFRSVLEILP